MSRAVALLIAMLALWCWLTSRRLRRLRLDHDLLGEQLLVLKSRVGELERRQADAVPASVSGSAPRLLQIKPP
jgi:hypothetical protein